MQSLAKAKLDSILQASYPSLPRHEHGSVKNLLAVAKPCALVYEPRLARIESAFTAFFTCQFDLLASTNAALVAMLDTLLLPLGNPQNPSSIYDPQPVVLNEADYWRANVQFTLRVKTH